MPSETPVVIVTGAAGGIGLAIAQHLAEDGALVLAADRTPGTPAHPGIRPVRADVSDPADVAALIAVALDEHGQIDALVNNAAVSLGQSFLDTTLATWERTLAINLTGTFLCAQAVAQAMVARGVAGRIVNLASLNSMLAERDAAAYVASKGGVLQLTRAMAVDLAAHRITANAICPGPILTENNGELFNQPSYKAGIEHGIPLGRAGLPDEVAGAVSYLLSESAAYVTGTTLVVDGGYSSYLRLD